MEKDLSDGSLKVAHCPQHNSSLAVGVGISQLVVVVRVAAWVPVPPLGDLLKAADCPRHSDSLAAEVRTGLVVPVAVADAAQCHRWQSSLPQCPGLPCPRWVMVCRFMVA